MPVVTLDSCHGAISNDFAWTRQPRRRGRFRTVDGVRYGENVVHVSPREITAATWLRHRKAQ
jgi:hypothetical protein